MTVSCASATENQEKKSQSQKRVASARIHAWRGCVDQGRHLSTAERDVIRRDLSEVGGGLAGPLAPWMAPSSPMDGFTASCKPTPPNSKPNRRFDVDVDVDVQRVPAAGRATKPYRSSCRVPPGRNTHVRVTQDVDLVLGLRQRRNGWASCTTRNAASSSNGVPLERRIRLLSTPPSRRTTLITTWPPSRRCRASSGNSGCRRARRGRPRRAGNWRRHISRAGRHELAVRAGVRAERRCTSAASRAISASRCSRAVSGASGSAAPVSGAPAPGPPPLRRCGC